MASMTNPTMKNRIEDKPGQVGQFAHETAERAKDTATSIGEKAKDAASNLGEKAKDAACSVAHKAEDAASFVGHKAEDAAGAVGSGLQSLGHTLREKTPQGGMMGDASSAVAQTLENTGRYLQEEGFKGMSEDLTSLIRRNPIAALLAGIGVGFLIAKATTSRS